jgi:hypothetical protein
MPSNRGKPRLPCQEFWNQGEYEQVYDAAEKQSRMLSGATCCIATGLADTAHPWAKLGENRTGVWTAAS